MNIQNYTSLRSAHQFQKLIHPPKNLTQLRNISGLLNFDKIYEKLLATMMISDMEAKMDPSQYGNQRGISIQHYLIKMVHRILTGEISLQWLQALLTGTTPSPGSAQH